jgi:hypothetical protein
MGVDLRMEPYATAYQGERLESRIMDELCFPDIDKLCDRLGLSWYDFYATVDDDGRLPHEGALKLLAACESHHALARNLLTLLRHYREWYEHPDRVATQIQGISKGSAPGTEGRIDHLADKRPWLVLK